MNLGSRRELEGLQQQDIEFLRKNGIVDNFRNLRDFFVSGDDTRLLIVRPRIVNSYRRPWLDFQWNWRIERLSYPDADFQAYRNDRMICEVARAEAVGEIEGLRFNGSGVIVEPDSFEIRKAVVNAFKDPIVGRRAPPSFLEKLQQKVFLDMAGKVPVKVSR